MTDLYEAFPTFATALDQDFDSGQSTMVVKDIDDKYMPPASEEDPQLLTIIDQSEEILETVEYTGKDEESNQITISEREVEAVGFDGDGNGYGWSEGAVVGRYHTALDQNGIIESIKEGETSVGGDEPEEPEEGDTWVDTNNNEWKIYLDEKWKVIAFIEDIENLQGDTESTVADVEDTAESKADDPHDNTQHSEEFAKDGDTQPPEGHNNDAHTENYSTTTPSDVDSLNWGDYEIGEIGNETVKKEIDQAESNAKDYTDSHESDTSYVHGVGESNVASQSDVDEKADDPHDNTQHSEEFAKDGDEQPPEDHNNNAHTENYSTTTPSDVDSSNWGDYEIQKDGTDDNGIINFKTE